MTHLPFHVLGEYTELKLNCTFFVDFLIILHNDNDNFFILVIAQLTVLRKIQPTIIHDKIHAMKGDNTNKRKKKLRKKLN